MLKRFFQQWCNISQNFENHSLLRKKKTILCTCAYPLLHLYTSRDSNHESLSHNFFPKKYTCVNFHEKFFFNNTLIIINFVCFWNFFKYFIVFYFSSNFLVYIDKNFSRKLQNFWLYIGIIYVWQVFWLFFLLWKNLCLKISNWKMLKTYELGISDLFRKIYYKWEKHIKFLYLKYKMFIIL